MKQIKNKTKRTRLSLLPSNEPVTMRDKYDSFLNQYLYDIDFETPSENSTNSMNKVSVCAVWPRPRFMLQINTPSNANLQPFYQNKLNLMPMINMNQSTNPLIYQKKKYHLTKKDDSIEQSNFSNTNTNLSHNIRILGKNDQKYTLPQFQINTSQFSKRNQNSTDFLSSSQSERANENINQLQEHEEKHLSLDQMQILNGSQSQPQLIYQNSQKHSQTQKNKSKIIQPPLNVSGIQFTFQQEQLMKLPSFQKLQQTQKLQTKSKVQNQMPKPNQNEADTNSEISKIADENENSDENDPKAQKKRKSKPRQSFTPEQKMLLEKFIYDHIDHPYAEHEDLIMLEKQTNLTRKQIRVFMTNTRMRKFAGNKIPVLKKSGNIVMRKGVPLHGPIGRVDPKNQCLIQCFPKKINLQMKIPLSVQIQPDSAHSFSQSSESQNHQINQNEIENAKTSNSQ